jgi:hypothetical protein
MSKETVAQAEATKAAATQALSNAMGRGSHHDIGQTFGGATHHTALRRHTEMTKGREAPDATKAKA